MPSGKKPPSPKKGPRKRLLEELARDTLVRARRAQTDWTIRSIGLLLGLGLVAGCVSGGAYTPPTREVWAYELVSENPGPRHIYYQEGPESDCVRARTLAAAHLDRMAAVAPGLKTGHLGPCQPAHITAGAGWWAYASWWLGGMVNKGSAGVVTTSEAACRSMAAQQLAQRAELGRGALFGPSACGPVSLSFGGRP